MRSDFSSSRLVRLLGAWSPEPLPAGDLDLAERLGLWVSAFDAIKLQSVHQALRQPRTGAAADARQRAAAASALQEQMQRVRAALAHAIGQDPLALAGADPAAPAYAPFQRRHAELQRHMEQMLAPLRAQARLSLGQASPQLQALATLDAAMQDMLAPREQQWLATLPAWIGRRFEQCSQAARQPQMALVEAAEPGTSCGDWLAAFSADWRQALLAELDLRLEPVAGLLAALNNELSVST